MLTLPVSNSPSLQAAAQRFLDDLRAWAEESIEKYSQAPAIDEHDQGTFITGWEPYLRVADRRVMQFVRQQRDRIRDHYQSCGLWKHGYWKTQEAHHGTEHFELFLGMLARLEPHDYRTTEQILDAAEHLGNWVEGIPAWFDWRSGLFHSVFLGTEKVGGRSGAEVNVPDHLRCVNIALLAYRLSGQKRYLELAAAHGRLWSQAILLSPDLPVVLLPGPDGTCQPLYQLEGEHNQAYRSFAGELTGDLSGPLERAENYLASDGINAFLRLWRDTGKEDFRQAAERLLDVLVTSLNDPDAGSAAEAVRGYWRATGSDRYNAAVLQAARQQSPQHVREISLHAGPVLEAKPRGIGKRSDMLTWLEDGSPRRCSPILLSLAAEIQGDTSLATQALDLARTYFNLAHQALPDGRNHGCAARTINAVARGHGRENHAGMSTAVLRPIIEAFELE